MHFGPRFPSVVTWPIVWACIKAEYHGREQAMKLNCHLIAARS